MLNIPHILLHPTLSPYALRPVFVPAASAAWPTYHELVDRREDPFACRRSGKGHQDNGDELLGTISRERFQMKQVR